MNDGVKILIERMESNAEEFFGRGKFSHIADMLDDYFAGRNDGNAFWFMDAEDIEQLRIAFAKFRQQAFSGETVKSLLAEPKEEEEKTLKGAYPSGWNDPRLMNAVKQNMALQNIELQNQALQNSILRSDPQWNKDATYQSHAEQQKSGGFMDAVARTMGLK